MAMHRTLALALVSSLLAACGSGDDAPHAPPPREDAAVAGDAGDAGDAGALSNLDDEPRPVPGVVDYGRPRSYLGGQDTGPSYRPPAVRSRTIEIILRSTPPGAEASVDGKRVGRTPTFWRGKMTDKPREFTFVLRNYAMARYRFVPTTNGVVHATLEPLSSHSPDAGPDDR